MRIGIEAQRIFRKKKHGMDMVALELVRQLQQLDSENEYIVFTKEDEDNGILKDSENVKIVRVKASPYPLWEQYFLPKAASLYNLDLLHCTSNTAPLWSSVPLVITLHDIIYLEQWNFTRGTAYQIAGNLYRRWNVPKVASKARHIITVSDFEKERIQKHFGYDDAKVSTIYNGVSHYFSPKDDKAELERVKRQYGLPDEYIFFLGNTDPKKNVPGVLKSLSLLKRNGKLSCKLLMLDIDRAYLANILNQIGDSSLIEDIIFCGYVPNKDLPAIHSQALMFLYPSLRESFGIPILEAMACGNPVITSSTSSMPEVAGDAALIVNPHNPEEIAGAIKSLLQDRELRKNLGEKGLNRAAAFTWKNNALKTLDIYRKVCKTA